MQAIFLHFDCWSWPMNGLIDLRYNLWGGKYECALLRFTGKVCLIIKYRIWHHKIRFLTNFYQMQLISCPYKAFPQIWPLNLTCTYWPQIKKILSSKLKLCVWNSCIKCTFHPKQLVSNHIESNAACIRSMQGIFLYYDCWSWPLNGLIDLG